MVRGAYYYVGPGFDPLSEQNLKLGKVFSNNSRPSAFNDKSTSVFLL